MNREELLTLNSLSLKFIELRARYLKLCSPSVSCNKFNFSEFTEQRESEVKILNKVASILRKHPARVHHFWGNISNFENK